MKTILLIEDNTAIRETIAEILELEDYRVETAEDGEVGIAKALITKPDVVICDVSMPVVDGYEVLNYFHKNPDLATIPFLFMTAKTEPAEIQRGLDSGADGYLTKPFDGAELLRAIEEQLKRPPNDKLRANF